MKPVTIENLFALAEGFAHKVLLDFKEKALLPTWTLLTSEGQVGIVGTPWDDEKEKAIARKKLKALFKEKKVIAYSFVCEAWYAIVEKEEWQGKTLAEIERPANRVDRIEVVFAAAVDKKHTLMRSWRIMRNWQGAVDKLEPIEGEGMSPGGWILEMLKD